MLHLPGFIVRSDVTDEERAAEIKGMRDYIRARENVVAPLVIDQALPLVTMPDRMLAMADRAQPMSHDR